MQEEVVNLESVNVYQKKNLILSAVNLHVAKNQFVYLIGKTGSGKSSLLKVLYGDIKITQGEGSVAGYNLVKLKNKDVPFLRRKLGIVFQDFQLLGDRTVKDNLMFVLHATGWEEKGKMNDRINDVLNKVGLSTKGFKMPHELSGGEQQRLAIARALLNDPELILADEPSGNLDPETSNEIMNLFFELSKTSCSVIMATHNYSLIERYPSRIVKIDLGKVTEAN
ncbi:MAG TPA: ATP-binding cassette domain-containing protein [Bacteroidia bacterium]|nr:ATP-binding cassette domain-containing protein [Bacteroidia bacterium]HNU34758.1 ATP-binding cassette domain-containing protein [Bacteroidia bacterium]